MKEVIFKIDGMMCGMCEAHVNDAIRKAVSPKKVSSSHSKGETRVICEDNTDINKIKDAVTSQGYKVLEAAEHPYEKKGLFGFLKNK